jgi:hypothetical protein
MIGHPESIGVRLQDLTIQFGAEVMRSIQRYNELLQRLAGGELDDTAARDAYLLFLRDETERYFRNVSDVSSGYYDAVLELASMYSPPFFEQAVLKPRPRLQAPSQPAAGTIELRGAIGNEVVSEFLVHNPNSRSEEVTFAVSEFTGPPGIAPFRPPLRLQPPRFTLERSESQVVRVFLPLAAGLFVPNQRYTAVLTVRKRDPFDLAVHVTAIAPGEDTRG